jgi:preprotein translocase subunit SecA/nephrocystin-3
MGTMGLVSTEGKQHLKEALAIAAELRLRTYCHNFCQKELMSTYTSVKNHLSQSENSQSSPSEGVFHITDTSVLHHFYYILLRLQTIVQDFSNREQYFKSESLLKTDNIFDDSDFNRGMVHVRFLEYELALHYLEKAKKSEPKNLEILVNLFFLYDKTGNIVKLTKVAEEILHLEMELHQEEDSDYSLASSYENLGGAYFASKEFKQAAEYCEKALDIRKKSQDIEEDHVLQKIAINYNNLGEIYRCSGENDLAIQKYNCVLAIARMTKKDDPFHPSITRSYDILGYLHNKDGRYDKAIKCFQKSLELRLKLYEQNPIHLEIARSYDYLGSAYYNKVEYTLALQHFHQVLEINEKIYLPNHPSMAKVFNHLGIAYLAKGEIIKSIGYFNQALEVFNEIPENTPYHLSMAFNFVNLGSAYFNLKNYDLSIKNYTEALNIYNGSYGANDPYRAASCYDSLGEIYLELEKYNEAIGYFSIALSTKVKLCPSPNHPDIADSYNYLASAHRKAGDNQEADTCLQKSARIKKALSSEKSNPGHYQATKIIFSDESSLEGDEATEPKLLGSNNNDEFSNTQLESFN